MEGREAGRKGGMEGGRRARQTETKNQCKNERQKGSKTKQTQERKTIEGKNKIKNKR